MKMPATLWKGFIFLAALPLHGFLLCLYAILSYLAVNLAQVNPDVANRLLLYFTLGTLVLLLLLRLLMRDLARAGMNLSLFLLFFFLYEPVKAVLAGPLPVIAHNRILLPVFLLLFAGGFYLLARQPAPRLRAWTPYLNLVGVILLLFPSYRILAYEQSLRAFQENTLLQLSQDPEAAATVDSLPDVYFIVLDGYARADTLAQVAGLDNSDFLSALRERGFYVADCSMSNYAQTELSLASTLNMTYLDEVLADLPPERVGEGYLSAYIQHSLVRGFFESLGYDTVAFYNGYYWAHWEDATYFLGDPRLKQGMDSLIPFEEEFLGTTFFQVLFDTYRLIVPQRESELLSGEEADRTIVRYTLDNLPVAAQRRSPKFVFVHLMLPHPPYVFGSEGEEISIPADADPASLIQGYQHQVLYANLRILPILDGILAQDNAVIFIEGDHGLIDYQEDWQRLANLGAYYFPDQDYARLHPAITPVNSFRLILSQYFGQDLPLLEDLSYYSSDSTDRTLELVLNPCTDE